MKLTFRGYGGVTMMGNSRREDAELLARKCRELEELARYSGFELGAYLLSVSHAEFMKQQERDTGRPAARKRTGS